MAPPELAGKHVLVTGAGTGIGRAVALRLARSGAKLSLLGRRSGPLGESAALALAAGAQGCSVATADVCERDPLEQAFEGLTQAHGPLYALVANAGLGGPDRPDGSAGRDRFGELVATNLLGTYHCLRAAERRLENGPQARHLVIMGSVLGRIGVPGYAGYCASKAGLLGLTRALALELAPRNVQVNAVCPGWVDTDMARSGLEDLARTMGVSTEEARRRALSEVPLRRMSMPEEIAGLVAWLISADARGVTGQGLDVNNGAFML